MKNYRTYRYGYLAWCCLYASANKRDKETKRTTLRRWGIKGHSRFNTKKMRKGNEL